MCGLTPPEARNPATLFQGRQTWGQPLELESRRESEESIRHWCHIQTRVEARQVLFAYIEGFYNARRVQKRLGYLSPLKWLNQYQELSLVGIT